MPRKENSVPSRQAHLHGGTIINIITGLIFLGLIVYGGYWIMKTIGEGGKQYATAVVNTQDKSMTLTCQMNLRSIYQTLQTYAISNESLPGSQQELVDFAGYGSKLFHCTDPNGSEYTYVPGRRTDASTPAILVYESKPVHNGKCNVLLTDGQIVLLDPEELKLAVEAMQTRRR